MSTAKQELLQLLALAGQEHLLAFWDTLDEQWREHLAAELSNVNFAQIARLYRERDRVDNVRELADRAGPPPAFRLGDPRGSVQPAEAVRRGVQALRAGAVGTLLVAGGQGTRLGFDHPKGMFPIGPISKKSLFQIHLEKIVAASHRYGVSIPLYLMTSPATHAETVEYFARNDRFGLPEADLRIFCQGTMPAVDRQTGKVLLAEPGRLALSPDGHGGMLAAFAGSGALADAQRRGLRHLFYSRWIIPWSTLPGRNSWVITCWPESELSTQVIAKRDPLEKVGNVVEVDGRLRVIEYIDLPDDVARRRQADGSLAIWAGSIGVHAMEVAFLARMAGAAQGLPFHFAYKRVPYVGGNGQRVEPREPNAIKFERFVFDLLPSAEHAIVVEVDAAEHFAPLKNASGQAADTPETVQEQMASLYRRWLVEVGAEVAPGTRVEISPLVALDSEQLGAKIGKGARFEKIAYLNELS